MAALFLNLYAKQGKNITVISDTHGVIDEGIIPHLIDSDMIVHVEIS